MEPIESLHSIARDFGPSAAREKLRRLADVANAKGLGIGALRSARASLDFIRAYPDDRKVLGRVREVIAALPPLPSVSYSFSYGSVQRLMRIAKGKIEIAWSEVEEPGVLQGVLELLVTPGETLGLDDDRISLEEWFGTCRPGAYETDLEYVVTLLENAGFSPLLQTHLYNRCELPLRYRGPASCEVSLPTTRVHFQREAIERGSFPLEPAIRKRPGSIRRGGQAHIDVAVASLCARKLEIYPLLHASADDVTIVEGELGLRVVLVGVQPEFRAPLESLYLYLVVKNEVPIAYGPAGVFLGCCEMGINLFPEFRGGEIRAVYAQVMRALHHMLGVEHFFLTRYGMGEGNPEAIASGAFWFYRKLGFRATNPEVERLAREEEARMGIEPGHRSNRSMLQRLSHTEAALDLSSGRCRPFDFSGLGFAQSRFIAARFGGRSAEAEARTCERMAKLLGLPRKSRALLAMAPLLAMVPDLAAWQPAEKEALARLVRAKDARSERAFARAVKKHGKLEARLRSLARDGRHRGLG